MYLFFSFNEIPWGDFWNFIRAFIYGSIGGFAAISMSYINNESTSVNLRNTALMKNFTSSIPKEKQQELQKRLEEIREPTRNFIFQAAMVHAFIGGISGMIAVSAFNPTANELQTFSIAVIAGVSGFAFLKRSALIDDKLSEKMLDVEKKAIEISIENNELLQSAEELSLLPPEPLDQFIKDHFLGEFDDDETLLEFDTTVDGSEEFEEFLNQHQQENELNNADINMLRLLFYDMGYSLEMVREFINDYEDL